MSAIELAPEIAVRVLPSLVRQADCRRVAISRRDDPAFPWDKLGDAIANEMLLLRGAIYIADGWKEERAWPRPSVEAVLCRGKSAVFESIETVPSEIAAAVRFGIDRARKRRAHMIRNADDLARMLGVDMATRERLKVWQIGATDVAWEERQARKRKQDTERRRAKRRAAGAQPRSVYEAGSIAEQARALGVSAATLRKRLSRARSKGSGHVTGVTARIDNNLADTHVTSDVLTDLAAPLSGGAAQSLVAENERDTPIAIGAISPTPRGFIMTNDTISPGEQFLSMCQSIDPVGASEPHIRREADSFDELLADCPDSVRASALHPAALAVRAHNVLGLPTDRDLAIEAMMAA